MLVITGQDAMLRGRVGSPMGTAGGAARNGRVSGSVAVTALSRMPVLEFGESSSQALHRLDCTDLKVKSFHLTLVHRDQRQSNIS